MVKEVWIKPAGTLSVALLSTLLLHNIPLISARSFSSILCFDTKCAVISESNENIVRYEDCEPSMQRVVFCRDDREECVHNPMTGQGICRALPTETPPESASFLSDQQKLILEITLPLIFLLLLLCCYCCCVKKVACCCKRKERNTKIIRKKCLPSFIEVDIVISNLAAAAKLPPPRWVENFANYYEREDSSPVSEEKFRANSSSGYASSIDSGKENFYTNI